MKIGKITLDDEINRGYHFESDMKKLSYRTLCYWVEKAIFVSVNL